MEHTKNIEALESLLRPVLEDLGYELVDLQLRSEWGRLVLRLLVDRPGGISLDECAKLSREVSPHLEVEDPIAGKYVLEVSSPGVQRPLKRAADFERFRGERVVVRTSAPIDGRKTFRGENLGLDEAGNLLVADRDSGRRHTIPISAVRRANLDPELRF